MCIRMYFCKFFSSVETETSFIHHIIYVRELYTSPRWYGDDGKKAGYLHVFQMHLDLICCVGHCIIVVMS